MSAASSSVRVFAVTMPKWGIEMQEGTITAWNVEPGRRVEKGDPLLDVETEKIVNSVESPASGTLRRIVAETGETQKVGALIAVLADPSVPDVEIDAFVRDFKPADASFDQETGAAPAAAAAPAPSAPASSEPEAAGGDGDVHVSPIARRVAERLGVDLSRVRGTGRNGRISKEDVEAYAASLASQPAPTPAPAAAPSSTASVIQEPAIRERLTSMRSTIARRLSESKQTIPHYRLTADLDVEPLVARRAALAASGQKVSINDLLLQAVARALAAHPRVNAQFTGDEVLQFRHADVAVAVATDGGLVTPIVRRADTKTVTQLAAEVRDLSERARSGRLTREEITGGTFTVSNLGMFGVRQFDAIINPPQVAILAVGAAEPRAVVRDGQVVAGLRMTVNLSSDHRVVDGAVAAAFLATLGERVRDSGD